ncbi:outer membrane beta-barrel protein, partial [Thermodesulfobacteriota bacterium]
GPLRVKPGITIDQRFTDNLFQENAGEKSDAVTTVTPAIAVQLPYGRNFYQLTYHADVIKAWEYDAYDATHHFANASLTFNTNMFQVTAADGFSRSSTPPDSPRDIRNDYYQNTASIDAAVRLADRYRLRAFVNNEFQDYDADDRLPGDPDPELDNLTKNEVGLNVFYRFLPLTSVLFEYGLVHTSNTDKNLVSTDSDEHRAMIGLTWEPFSKIQGTVKAGYVKREYDVASRQWEGLGVAGIMTYDYSSSTQYRLTASRKANDTAVTQQQAPYGTYYVTTGADVSLRHGFNYKISALLEAGYSNDDYKEPGLAGLRRKDDRMRAAAGFRYDIQDWLRCTVRYSFVNNDSNVGSEDYTENALSLIVWIGM